MTDKEIEKIREKIKFLRDKNNPYGVEGQVLDWVNRCDLILDDLVYSRRVQAAALQDARELASQMKADLSTPKE